MDNAHLDSDEHGADRQFTASRLETGSLAFALIARIHGLSVDLDQLRHEYAREDGKFGALEMVRASKPIGLKARRADIGPSRLKTIPLPVVARMKDGEYVVLAKRDGDQILMQDPRERRPRAMTCAVFQSLWSGEVVLFASRTSYFHDVMRFDFSWFVPAVIKYRRMLGEVLVASFFLQCIALVTPLFFQVVTDKVLVHRALNTLDVLVIGLFAATTFEVALTALRTYVFAHTTSRIDVELGAKLFRHLLRLPISYFTARRVGDSVARIRELENIRAFLTGNALTVLLDVVFSTVFIAVMAYYSPPLTLIVLASLPCYFVLALLVTPILRRRLDEKFARGAENQAFLVETISGIETLKASAVEPQWIRQWENQLAGYISASFRTTKTGMWANTGVSYIDKLVTIGTMWWGARWVIEGSLSIGQLIAFNMLAARVSGPVMRMAQLWTDFQQVGISMQRLGDILNTRVEPASQRSSLPRVLGTVEFDNLDFRYQADGPEVLRGLSLRIDAGESVGIVGRSGSGKSTLARLLQRLHTPARGRVLIDGVDLSTIDPTSLRRQIGVVLQENMLFNRTIRQNIALSDPGAPMEAVVACAKLAGAHEFISELPDGYDTMVGEHGATLSGGQRQRIAIARALIGNPRILIFDEATSALDYDSERMIQQSMAEIRRGRTVIIVAHRLSAVAAVDRLIVMDRGVIVEQGRPAELLSNPQSWFCGLHRMQMGGA